MKKLDFLLSCDNGLSSSKVLWTEPGGRTSLLLLPSEMKYVRSEDLIDRGLKAGTPDSDAWIETIDGELIAVGQKAKNLRGQPPLTQTKYQPSIAKILACVGIVGEKLGLNRTIRIGLGTLLPYAEYQDRESFAALLRQNLRDFKFRGKKVAVELEELYIQPEGAGIASSWHYNHPAFENENVLVVMLGHRDVSLLPFEMGSPVQLDQHGEQIGFIRFQTMVKDRAALNTTPQNLALLPQYLYRGQWEPEYTERIASWVVRGREKERKIRQINEAVDVSRRLYVEDLCNFITTTCDSFLRSAHQVIVAGGPALYFQDDLKNFFESYPNLRNRPLSWGMECEESVRHILGDVEPDLLCRISDIFSIHEGLMEETDITSLPAPAKESVTEENGVDETRKTTKVLATDTSSTVKNGGPTPQLPPVGRRAKTSK